MCPLTTFKGNCNHCPSTTLHRLPIFHVDLHCALHRVATSSCRGHVDELATEPFQLLHRKHRTDYRRSWNCCDRQTRNENIFVSFCLRAPSASVTVTQITEKHSNYRACDREHYLKATVRACQRQCRVFVLVWDIVNVSFLLQQHLADLHVSRCTSEDQRRQSYTPHRYMTRLFSSW